MIQPRGFILFRAFKVPKIDRKIDKITANDVYAENKKPFTTGNENETEVIEETCGNSQSVSQESILHHSTKPASLLWLLLLYASFCLTPLFVHDLLFSPHVRFLMLVPKSGKAEGMTRPPSTSHLTPCLPHFTPLPSPWTPVTINIMTLWSSVIHICMFDY